MVHLALLLLLACTGHSLRQVKRGRLRALYCIVPIPALPCPARSCPL